jgi:sterol desaturase/sphingolipid hydroxylase (fatty acid hydroxylase superfamily)
VACRRPAGRGWGSGKVVTYLHWLVLTSVVFLAIERLCPSRRAQPALRPGFMRDIGFLALNGHLIGLWTAGLNGWVAIHATVVLRDLGVRVEHSPVAAWPLAAQLIVLLLLSDFLQWCIHNLLHRVPWLWQFHKVHHSIRTMDWLGNWRFHWMEIVVYRSLQWLPLAALGASPQAALAVAVVSTLWGDFNHANVDAGLGRLGYVFNNPRMHLWHHDASDEGGVAKNFGIVFSLWDHLFATAHWPKDRAPGRLGYAGDVEMPGGLPGQLAWPLAARRPALAGEP